MLILARVKSTEDGSLALFYVTRATINKSKSSWERSARLQLLLIPLHQHSLELDYVQPGELLACEAVLLG